MTNAATTVEEYLRALPGDRQTALRAVREVILANLPEGYVERMNSGMIGYVVPHSLYPAGYRGDPRQPLPFAFLSSQKNHLAIHLMNVYSDPAAEQWFRNAWKAAGKKLDMGKSCVRFKRLADVPLEVIGQAIARTPVKTYIAGVENALAGKPGKVRRVASVS